MKKILLLGLVMVFLLQTSVFANTPFYYKEGSKYYKAGMKMPDQNAANQYFHGVDYFFKNYTECRFTSIQADPTLAILNSLGVQLNDYVKNEKFEILSFDSGEATSGPYAPPGKNNLIGDSKYYDQGWLDAKKFFTHGKNGKLLTMEEQFQLGQEALSKKDYLQARARFAFVVRNEPKKVKNGYKIRALWYVAQTERLIGRHNGSSSSLENFLLSYRQAPQCMREDTILNIALDLRFNASMYSHHKKWDKLIARTIVMLEKWLIEFKGSKRTVEALYYLGLANANLGRNFKASRVFKRIRKEYPNTKFAKMAAEKNAGLKYPFGRSH